MIVTAYFYFEFIGHVLLFDVMGGRPAARLIQELVQSLVLGNLNILVNFPVVLAFAALQVLVLILAHRQRAKAKVLG